MIPKSRIVCFTALLFCAFVAGAAPHPFSVDDLVRLRRVSEPALSPDGRTVVFTVRETDLEANRGRTDLWALDVVTKGAQPRRITSHVENDGAPEWSRDGRWIYFLSGRSGSDQVWRLDMAGGEAQQVTHLPLDVTSFRVSPDGTKLAVSLEVFPDCADLACTTQRLNTRDAAKSTGMTFDRLFVRHWDTWKDQRQSRLFLMDLRDSSAQPVAIASGLDADIPSKPFGDRNDYTFSPDSQRLVFSARVKGRNEPWSTNFDLFEVALAEPNEVRNLTESNPAWDAQPVFSPDGRLLAWRAMTRPGFEADRFRIVLRDLSARQDRVLTEGWDRSAGEIAFSMDGKTLYTTSEHFGQHPLWSIDVKSGKPTMLTGPGHVSGYSVGERDIVYTVDSLKSPAELAAVTTRGDLRELPRMNAELLSDAKLGDVEQFTFAGWNGETVYGHVVRPVDFKAGAKYPIAFIVHGGPQVSFGNQWSYRWNPQTYAGAGYAAVFIDFHGSPGYGQAFTDSISGDWGGKPLEDLQKGLAAALDRFQWLDGDRACALGASYGGYMMNWMAGVWSEPFRCFVTHAGIFDNRAMAYTTEELWFDEWEFGGPHFDVPQNYEKHNPVNHVADWKKPMLVIHGQRDFRVPYAQGIAAFTALQRRGIESKLLIFPDENHWILKPANSVQWHREVEGWLGRWLKPAQ